MNILLKNGRVIDPASKKDGKFDILIEGDKIKEVAEEITTAADQVIDAKGCYVMPGFIDLHVHLREPGQEAKETIRSGGEAAVKGGFTTIVAMPNTNPVADSAEVISYVHQKAELESPAHVLQVGAITVGQRGEALADIDGMVGAGCLAISEDGKSVMNAKLYKEAMRLAAKNNIPVLAHCEDINMVNHGVMNEDEKSKELGLPGISNAVEDVIVARDILLAKETGASLHLCHCSTADSVVMVKNAKAAGLPVTAEVCPHHFILTTADMKSADANFKMNPPLRQQGDVDALRQGLKDNIMDVIATDHAPHTAEEKARGMEKAPFGIVGLETCLALTLTELVDTNVLTLMQMAEKLSYNPARVLGLDKGSLEVGKIADIVVFNPHQEYTIDVNEFVSKGKNSPFHGHQVRGQVVTTIVDGKIAYQA